MSLHLAGQHVVSVNVGRPREVEHGGRTVLTGIFKEPVEGHVAVGHLGLAGDGQADVSVHGGLYKAVYAYSWENVLYWRRALGREDIGPGFFGENLTVDDMPDDAVHIGDVLRIGDVLLRVTQGREPCYKLALRAGVPDLPKRFLRSGRVGFYLEVLEGGELCAGDPIELVASDPARLSVYEATHLLHFDPTNLDGARRALDVEALSPAWKRPLERRLAEAT